MDVSRATTSHDPIKSLFDGLKRQQGASARVTRMCRMLDEKLEALPNDTARRALLDDQLQAWIGRYEQFAIAVDMGAFEPGPDGPDAFDYTMLISEIGARQSRYTSVAA